MTAWIILGIIYAVCYIPACFITRIITSTHPMKRVGFFFLTVWLIMPLFPIYFIITYIEKKHEQRNNNEEGR